jgi:hypothetical protein
VKDLVEADLWSQLPADLPTLLALLPRADLYLQDEVQFAFHPTLTRVWSLKGRRGNASWKRRARTGIRLWLWVGGLERRLV